MQGQPNWKPSGLEEHHHLDFIVMDTEGSPALRELAVLDSQGQLLYEAFVAEHPANVIPI